MKDADAHIAALLKNADTREAGFKMLVNRYSRPLYARIRAIVPTHPDADDALQNTFIKVWNNLERFRGDSRFYTWIYRIATNEALMLVRKRKDKPYDFGDPQPSPTQPQAHTDGPGPEEISEKLRRAVESLPEKQRQIFEMRYFGEMSYAEMAELTKTSIGALKAGYFHAVKKIENSLGSSD